MFRLFEQGLYDFFLKAVNLSLTACLLILVVLILRLVFRKAPRWIICLLWGLVALRLICPISIESSFSLIPGTVSNGTLVSEWADYYVGDTWIIEESPIYYEPAVTNGREPLQADDGSYYVVAAYDQLGEPATIENTVVPILGWIWVAGMVVMLVYSWGSYLGLKRRVAAAIPLQGNIKQSEKIEVPFVLGFFHPVIYVPYKLADSDLEYVIAHEEAHIRRRDHWWKPIGFVILSIYWFNPLLWVAYVLLCKDIELACDEKVIRSLGMEQRQDYSLALLNCSVKRYRIAACPLAFGEVSVKERVKSVMSYKKPTFWIVVAGVAACVVAAVCFLTNPKEKIADPLGHSYRVSEIIYDDRNFSFTYEPGVNTSYFKFNSDYTMETRGISSSKWRALECEVEEIELTDGNFLAYLNWERLLGRKICEENVKTWWIESTADNLLDKNKFYYLMLQENGDVYLSEGYINEDDAEDRYIRWIYKLEQTEKVFVTVETVVEYNRTQSMSTKWYENGKFDFDYDSLPSARVNGEGTVGLDVEIEGDTLVVYEEYYAYTASGGTVEKNTYELTRDEDGKFNLEVSRRNDLRDEQAIYYVETETGTYVFKIEFPLEWEEKSYVQEAGKLTGSEKSKEQMLDDAISETIIKQNTDYYPAGNFACENHIILKTEQISKTPKEGKENHFDEVTVYAMVYYAVFSNYGGELQDEGSSHLPVIMTFETEENGDFRLTDYWQPSSGGADYFAEVKEAFPDELEADALDTQKYIKEQQKACEQKAMEYMEEYGSVDQQIAVLLDKMSSLQNIIDSSNPEEFAKKTETYMSMIFTSSSPADYIEWFGEDYEQLLVYDSYALRYCFEQFLEGGQTDLRGQIMAQACQDIMAEKGEALSLDYEVANGQEWFEAFKANVKALERQYRAEDFEKFYPVSWMLKQMLEEKVE